MSETTSLEGIAGYCENYENCENGENYKFTKNSKIRCLWNIQH